MIHVAGGTYTEFCHFPHWHELYGSGGRAAAVLAGLSEKVVLSTFSSADGIDRRKFLGDAFGFDLANIEVAPEVVFEYLHPLRCRSVSPSKEQINTNRVLKITDSIVLRFGFWEGDSQISAEFAVYDPQSPGNPVHFGANGSTAEHLAIVCNFDEGKFLTGEMTQPKL